MKHMLIKVDGKELTKADIGIVRECCSKFDNFEMVPKMENWKDHVDIDKMLKKAIDECLANGNVSEETWRSLSSQPRVREIVTCLKKDYWRPVVSQRVQVLRQIANPSNPAQNLWDI
ncbi:hypothetical protein GBAR_LOCUS20855 [Geodia barretti]|uniref:Uncharacterized protein n=1 Tax=Geodia barretti TaxID=519541 RepID=A0AA35SWS8_GEOBA|nr:hypothetical protein GBAR_LOCUS20855 [Geodia barretti]